ncbi:MAG TPA: YceH family protein [Edaphobacter sp.]|jgi:uncharacterized protein YceH (UPF0502 family)|nr:YceH family protein [Edaphobacter sp.]
MHLDSIQLRVLGSLIEKEITTPENYPLSLNALINACNQRSSRDPVLDLKEDEVRQALHSLEDMGLVTTIHDARVAKYEHRIRTVLNLRRDETAVLCLLMLRGPQTPGEIRSRADRLYSFDDLATAQSTLERLANRSAADTASNETGPLTTVLPRQPGSREARYAHLLGALPEKGTSAERNVEIDSDRASDPSDLSTTQRLARMEAEITSLTTELQGLRIRIEHLEATH